jgi:hypothetical protein
MPFHQGLRTLWYHHGGDQEITSDSYPNIHQAVISCTLVLYRDILVSIACVF